MTEITLAAILAVGTGQEEAARSVGMTKAQSLRYVIIPQALKLMVPPMIGVSEMTRQGEMSILRFQGDVMFIYAVVATLYFATCYPVLRFACWAESKLGTVKVSLD